MKTKTALALLTLALTPFTLAEDHSGHDHSGHDHSGHDHGDHAEHKEEASSSITGPNQGRIITDVEPHIEFFVTEDKKIKLTFLDEEGKEIAPSDQVITAIGGDRSAPTKLTFASEEGVLISDKILPEGKDIPIILMIKSNPEAKTVHVKFNINLNSCPTCKSLEYACACEH